MTTVDRRDDPADAFLLHRAQEIARISSSSQPGLRHRRRVESAFKCKPGLHRRVIKRADDEIFARVSARAIREFFIFDLETLHDLRPWNFRARLWNDYQTKGCESEA